MMRIDRGTALVLLLCCLAGLGGAKTKAKKDPLSPSSLSQFLQRVKGEQTGPTTSMGSLWPLEGGPFTDLATDYKARRLNDIVVIRIVEQTLAQASGSVAAQRGFTSNSAITAVAGRVNTGADESPLRPEFQQQPERYGDGQQPIVVADQRGGPGGCHAAQWKHGNRGGTPSELQPAGPDHHSARGNPPRRYSVGRFHTLHLGQRS